MKKLTILLLLSLCVTIQAEETTNYDIAVAIVELSKGLNGVIESGSLRNLIDDIVYALDEKDKAIDYNASIAREWKRVAEENKRAWWGISANVLLQDWKPSIGVGIILLF
jgi:hypothetical protein